MKDHISYSQIEVGKCPARYKAIYLDKKYKNAPGINVKIGSFIHELCNEYVRYCVENKTEGDIEILDKLFKMLWKKSKLPEEFFEENYNQMLMFGEKEVNYDNVLSTEQEINLQFDPDDPKKLINMRLDILRVYYFKGLSKKANEHILTIVDYKNQANILKQEDTLTDQLKIYTLGAMSTHTGYKYVRRGIYYTRYNFARFYEDEDNPTGIDDLTIEMTHTRDMLIREWDKLKGAKEYPAIRGEWCYRYEGCPMLINGSCPAYSKDEKICTDINEMIREIWKAETQIKSMKDKARKYLKLNGNVVIDDKTVGYIEDDKSSYNLEKVVNLSRQVDIDISKVDFPLTGIKQIKKDCVGRINEDEILRELGKIEVVKKTTECKFKGRPVREVEQDKP